MLKTKFKKKLMTLATIVILLVSMTGNALAIETNDEYMDVQAVKDAYTELYAKYFPDTVTVSIDEGKFEPVLSSTLDKELEELEEYLKKASLPENNIIVEYDNNGRIVNLQYPKSMKDEAEQYINALEKQLAFEQSISSDISSVSTRSITVTRTIRHYWNIPLPWEAVYHVGYYATRSAEENINGVMLFLGKAYNIRQYTGYGGFGTCEDTRLNITYNEILDGWRTSAIGCYLGCEASYTANGITQTYIDDLYTYTEVYASSFS